MGVCVCGCVWVCGCVGCVFAFLSHVILRVICSAPYNINIHLPPLLHCIAALLWIFRRDKSAAFRMGCGARASRKKKKKNKNKNKKKNKRRKRKRKRKGGI